MRNIFCLNKLFKNLLFASLLFISSFSNALILDADAIKVRIKDITKVQGLRDQYLIGYGLVAGLPTNSGDRNNLATNLAQVNMLKNFGIDLKEFLINNQIDTNNIDLANPGQSLIARLRQLNGGSLGNIAAVTITAKVRPYTRTGDKFDVDVSSFASSRTLAGGILLQSHLKGPDGEVYAIAQGPVIASGYEVEANGSLARQGSPNSGRVPHGAILEFPIETTIDISDGIILSTEKIDFSTTKKIVDTINASALNRRAKIVDGRSISVELNGPEDEPTIALAEIGDLLVDSDTNAKVVILERTGTIVVGNEVKLAPVALAHGTLNITVRTRTQVSQPNVQTQANLNAAGNNTNITTNQGAAGPPGSVVGGNIGVGTGAAPGVSGGINSVAFQNSSIDLYSPPTQYVELEESATLSELVRELNRVGVTAQDMISIMQALKASGALQAELEII